MKWQDPLDLIRSLSQFLTHYGAWKLILASRFSSLVVILDLFHMSQKSFVSRALTCSCWPLWNLFIFCAFYFSFYSTLTHKVALFMWIYTRAMYDQKQHVMLISFLLDLPTSMNESWIRSGAAMCLNCLFFFKKRDFRFSLINVSSECHICTLPCQFLHHYFNWTVTFI